MPREWECVCTDDAVMVCPVAERDTLVALLRETYDAYRRTSHQGWCIEIESRSEADYQQFLGWRARLEEACKILHDRIGEALKE